MIEVRIQFVSALGKIAEAVGRQRFHPYIPTVLRHLQTSSNLTVVISLYLLLLCGIIS